MKAEIRFGTWKFFIIMTYPAQVGSQDFSSDGIKLFMGAVDWFACMRSALQSITIVISDGVTGVSAFCWSQDPVFSLLSAGYGPGPDSKIAHKLRATL